MPGFAPPFGERLKWVVEKIGTQKKAGELAGVKPEMIGKYISGKAKPSFYVMKTLAEAVNVSLDWIATGKDALSGSMVDTERLEQVVHQIEVHVAAQSVCLSASKKALLIKELYTLSLEAYCGDAGVPDDLVERLVRLAS